MKKPIQKDNFAILLEKIGLTENEAVLYTLMVKYMHLTVQKLQEISPFPRTQIYHILRQLAHHNLVSFIRKPKRTICVAEDPQILYTMLERKEQEFEQQKNQLKEAIPHLRNQYQLANKRPGVQIFEGIEEYRKALEDVINSKPDCVYTYMYISEKKKAGVEIRREMDKERIAWGIEEKILLFDTPQARAWAATRQADEKTTFKLSIKAENMFDADLKLYSKKMSYTTYEGREPIVIMTQDKNMYSLQKNIFESLWKTAEIIH